MKSTGDGQRMADTSRDGAGLDGQNLPYHPERVAAWLRGRRTYPLYVELGLTDRCNIACRFCALDHCRRRGGTLPRQRVSALLRELRTLRVRSLCFAGAGEPLLYPGLPGVLAEAAGLGFDLGMTTNGVAFTPESIAACCRHLAWVRLSLNALSPRTYARIHGAAGGTARRVLANLRALVAEKRRQRARVTIGVQALLLPDNRGELLRMARAVRAAGADYFSVKPVTVNARSGNCAYQQRARLRDDRLAAALARLSTGTFAAVYRTRAFAKTGEEPRPYRGCPGNDFFAVIYGDGSVYSCLSHAGEAAHRLGSLRRGGFRAVWDSPRRRRWQQRHERRQCTCPSDCRLDEVNRYLWRLQHPAAHASFL